MEPTFVLDDIDPKNLKGNLFVYSETETDAGEVIIPLFATYDYQTFAIRMRSQISDSSEMSQALKSEIHFEVSLNEFKDGKIKNVVLPCYNVELGRKYPNQFMAMRTERDDTLRAVKKEGFADAVGWYFKEFREQFQRKNVTFRNFDSKSLGDYAEANFISSLIEAHKGEDREKHYYLKERMITFFHGSPYIRDVVDLHKTVNLDFPPESKLLRLIKDRLLARLKEDKDLVARIDAELRKPRNEL